MEMAFGSHSQMSSLVRVVSVNAFIGSNNDGDLRIRPLPGPLKLRYLVSVRPSVANWTPSLLGDEPGLAMTGWGFSTPLTDTRA